MDENKNQPEIKKPRSTANTLISLRSLLITSSLAELGSGIIFLFLPDLISNPLQEPTLHREWEGGPAAEGTRPILGCTHLALGLLSGLSVCRPQEKVTFPVLGSLAFLHSVICIPIALKWGFSVSQVPGLVVHAFLGCGFLSYAIRAACDENT